MAALRTSYFGAAAPVALVLAYMLWHEDLQRAAAILIVCVLFTSAAMYFFYKHSESKVVEALNAGGVDRTLYKEYKKENLFETVERLRRKEGRTTAGDISVMSFLRETAHADALVAVELYDLGALSTILASLRTDNKDPKRLLTALETVNELLSRKEVKARLSTSVENIHSLTDVALQWVIALLATVQKENRVDSAVVQIASGASQGGVDVAALLEGDAVAFPAGDGATSRSDQLAVLMGKSLVCLGLLFSDDCVDAQSRATDRGGVSVLLSVLNVSLAMCSTTYNSAGIGNTVASGASKAGIVELTSELRALRLKQSALMCKWACCWCLFNLSLNHPPSKAVLFHSSGMRPVIDALKLHTDSAHVHRQGLALLFNLIAPDPYAKYSHAQARQMLMANSIVEVIEHAKSVFKKEKDVIATCRAILNIIAVDFS